MQFFGTRTFVSTMLAILATGAVLNMANRGTFGDAVKKVSNYITTGYGA